MSKRQSTLMVLLFIGTALFPQATSASTPQTRPTTTQPAARLTWEKTLISYSAKPGQKQVIVEFPFKNTGTTSLRIADVRTSCACTAAAANRKEFEVGDQGAITATLTVGDHIGTFEKRITVTFAGSASIEQVLTLQMTVPALVRLDQRYLYWRTGDARSSRTLTVTAASEIPITVVAVKSDDQRFNIQVKTVRDGQEYVVVVTPSQTESKSSARLQIQFALPDLSVRASTVGVEVLGRPPGTKAKD